MNQWIIAFLDTQKIDRSIFRDILICNYHCVDDRNDDYVVYNDMLISIFV